MKKLSIIIPVYNETNSINKIIDAVKSSDTLGLPRQIIVIDDASTDGTTNILKKTTDVKVITHPENLGKSAAVRTGLTFATGDYLLIQDADLEYSPENYPALLAPLVNGQADVVYGSRLLTGQPHRVLFYWHYLANLFLTFMSNIFSNLNLSDMETGYKVFTRDVINQILPHLQSTRFGFEPEVTALIGQLAAQNNCRVYEVGISYYGRTYAEGKKIRVWDAFHAVWCILKYNLRSTDFSRSTGKIGS